jgi:hypothetical protein
MQISGVSLVLTWPHRLCLLRVLCLQAAATSFPLSKHTGGGDLISQACVFLYSSREVGLPPSPVEFSSLHHSHKLSHTWLLGAHPRSLRSLSSQARLVYLQFWEGFPSLLLQHSGRPTLFATCLYCFYCLLLSFFFSPGWGSVCPRSYADLALGCLWEYRVPLRSPCPHLPKLSGCG